MASTKKDLVDRVAENTGDTHALVRTVVQRFFQEITGDPAWSNPLEFGNHGVFEPKITITHNELQIRMTEE